MLETHLALVGEVINDGADNDRLFYGDSEA